jgi:hypothetical protein
MSKADLPEVLEAFVKLLARVFFKMIVFLLLRADTGEGVRPLLNDLYKLVKGRGADEEDEDAAGEA